MLKSTMSDSDKPVGPVFLWPDWPAPPSVRAAVSTRLGGCSHGGYASLNLGEHCGDDPVAVTANRRCVVDALALPQPPRWLRQVHGCKVIHAAASVGEGADQVDDVAADGIWSGMPGAVCAVLTADCLPVLFCDVEGTVVAAAHAGWRGLAAGILEATIAALPASPRQLLAWLGPAIGPEAFEVGAEVRAAFVDRQPEARVAFSRGHRADAFFADLYTLARLRLAAAGVRQVYGGGWCTHTDAQRFFSFRREGISGRMASMIWLSDQ